jgi:hypothetical protein
MQGVFLPDFLNKGGLRMGQYVTYENLYTFSLVLIALASLIVSIYQNNSHNDDNNHHKRKK